MKILFFLMLIIANAPLCLSQPTLPEIISRSEKSVCLIETFDENGNAVKLGTGFFIDSSGICVSNYHVFEGSSQFKITTIDKSQYEVEEIIKSSKVYDLIIFKINKPINSNYLNLNKNIPQKGESVISIGNPEGLNWSVSEGIVSGIRQSVYGSILQITAPLSSGSSGSPILNKNGEVVGIATFLLKEGQNLNFALHIGIIDSIKSNVAMFENFNQKVSLPDDFEIAKNHIDSLIRMTEFRSKSKLSNETVIKYLNWFIEKYPNSAFGYIKKGTIYQNMSEWQKAYEMYAKAINVEPNNPEAYYHRAIFLRYQSYPFMSDNLKDKMTIAINDLKKFGSYSEENLLESYHDIASCYEEISDYSSALDYYTKYIEMNTTNEKKNITSAYVSRGHLYWTLNDLINAEKDLRKVTEISKDCYNTRWIVYFLVKNEKYEDASMYLDDECIADFDYELLYCKSLILVNIDGDLNKAATCIEKSISIIDDYVASRIMSKSDLEKYLRLSAYINELKKEPLETLRDLNRLIDCNPNLKKDFEINNWIIDTKYAIQDYLGALKDINILVEKFPNKYELFETKGMCLSMLNDETGAIKAYTKAIEIDPKNGRLYRLRGLSRFYNKDVTSACSDWSIAGDLGEYKAYEHIKEYCNK